MGALLFLSTQTIAYRRTMTYQPVSREIYRFRHRPRRISTSPISEITMKLRERTAHPLLITKFFPEKRRRWMSLQAVL